MIPHIHDNDQNEIVLPAKTIKQHPTTCDIPKDGVLLSVKGRCGAMQTCFYKHPVKCNGTIVGMEALDCQLFCISKSFEYHLKWTSILIEANPINFQKLLKNRPRSRNYNTAICR